MSIQQTIPSLLSQLFEISARINLETSMAAFVDMSGHVGHISVRVGKNKESYEIITSHGMYYHREWKDDKGEAEFVTAAKIALEDLNALLNKGEDEANTVYKAYCNLIDMSCAQTFTSEAAAQQWVKQMKEKYGKVHALIGYKKEQAQA